MTQPAFAADGREARHSSETPEHCTPPEYVEAARNLLGTIDLDPASNLLAQEVVKAETFWTAETNRCNLPTLVRTWSGRVLLNPPGGKIDDEGECLKLVKDVGYLRLFDGKPPVGKPRSSAKAWWWKLVREWKEQRVTSAVFVSFSLEHLQSCQVEPEDAGCLPTSFPMCVPSRRVAYWKEGPEGKLVQGKSPPHASAFIYLPPRVFVRDMHDYFAHFGAVLKGQWR